jgi:Protein of unknown function (DUF998)
LLRDPGLLPQALIVLCEDCFRDEAFIVSPLVYVAATILGAMRWEGYNSTSQAVSDLSAIGAPSRPIIVPLFLAYSVLAIAFGLGVRRSARRTRALRVTAGLLVAYGVVGLTGPLAPMHQRGAEGTLTDVMHIMLTIVTVLLILLSIGFGANAGGAWFRRYSIGTLVTIIAFGVLAGLDGGRLAAHEPTPWLGVTERIDIGAYLLWVAILAVVLLPPREAVPSRSQ